MFESAKFLENHISNMIKKSYICSIFILIGPQHVVAICTKDGVYLFLSTPRYAISVRFIIAVLRTRVLSLCYFNIFICCMAHAWHFGISKLRTRLHRFVTNILVFFFIRMLHRFWGFKKSWDVALFSTRFVCVCANIHRKMQ